MIRKLTGLLHHLVKIEWHYGVLAEWEYYYIRGLDANFVLLEGADAPDGSPNTDKTPFWAALRLIDFITQVD